MRSYMLTLFLYQSNTCLSSQLPTLTKLAGAFLVWFCLFLKRQSHELTKYSCFAVHSATVIRLVPIACFGTGMLHIYMINIKM